MKQHAKKKKGSPQKKSGSSSFPIINKMPRASISARRSTGLPYRKTGMRSRYAPSAVSRPISTPWPRGSKQCGITTVAMESTGVYWIPATRSSKSTDSR